MTIIKYKISLSKDKTYVKIRVLEAFNGETEKEFIENAIQDAKQHHISKFLVDVRGTPNKSNSLEQYLLAYVGIDQFGLGRDSRIAILAGENDKSHTFTETVFVNAGYHCRIFPNVDDALIWLGVEHHVNTTLKQA